MDTSLNVAYGPQITAAATRHNLQPRLLAAVAAQETGGPGADSGRNIVGDQGHGHGLFQIDDRWHAFARTPAAMDPAKNADYAAGMLASSLERYGGDVHKALSAYNTGSPTATGTRTDWGDGKPIGYADSVLRHYARIGGAAAPPAPAPADARDAAESVDSLRGAARPALDRRHELDGRGRRLSADDDAAQPAAVQAAGAGRLPRSRHRAIGRRRRFGLAISTRKDTRKPWASTF